MWSCFFTVKNIWNIFQKTIYFAKNLEMII